MSDRTVRDIIAAYNAEMRDTDLQPGRAREIVWHLNGLVGTAFTERRLAETAYNAALLAAYDTEGAATRAKLKAQASPEYQRLRLAQDVCKQVEGMLSSLKAVLRSIQEEMRLAS